MPCWHKVQLAIRRFCRQISFWNDNPTTGKSLAPINSGTEILRATPSPVVHIIDDDVSTRRALTRLMRSAGFGTLAFASVEEFLASDFQRHHACIVADVHMPGISALELPARLKGLGVDIPVIFVTADYSPDTRERVRDCGGVGYFNKPVDDQALIDTIQWAVTD